jgi:uncharacterized protein with ParB-like and HNH nuclease domain
VPVGVTKHLVIDGQQRLTTLSILLSAIRKLSIDSVDLTTSGIIEDFLINRHYPSPDNLKVVPTQVDREAYKALVYVEELDNFTESRIVKAYDFFLKKLAENDDDGEPISPLTVLETIQQSLQVVMINLGKDDDPYLIFESLNHKGKPLSQSDLVRNYVLMRFQHSDSTGGQQETIYNNLWRPMEDALKDSMSEFLRHYGMRKGHNVRKGDIYTASKNEFEKLPEASKVESQLAEMKLAALIYSKFIDPSLEGNARISRRLKALQELDSTVFYPLILRIYRSWQQEKIDSEELVDCLAILESFYVRRMSCAVPTNALNKVTLELCAHVPDEKPNDWLRENLSNGSSGRRWPKDDEFREALIQQSIYPRRRLARFMLISLEASFDHNEPADVTNSTIEHVMPQTLSDQWIEDLGDKYLEIHSKWIDTLGNLTLSGYNSSLGNDPFSTKKEKLAISHYEITRDILEEELWSSEQIRERGAKLADRALSQWGR